MTSVNHILANTTNTRLEQAVEAGRRQGGTARRRRRRSQGPRVSHVINAAMKRRRRRVILSLRRHRAGIVVRQVVERIRPLSRESTFSCDRLQ